MTEKLKLEVLLTAIDKVTRPLKAIAAGSNETAKALKAAKDQLKELNDANARIDAFRKASKDAAITANQLKAAQQRLREVKQAMSETLTPSRELQRALKDARQEVSYYGMRLNTLVDQKRRLRQELEAAGVPLKDLKRHQGELAQKIDAATAAVARQTAAMKAQNAVAQRMHAARAAYEKSLATRDRLAGAGVAAGAAGASMGLPVAKAARDYATFEDAMLGVARQVDGARDDSGRLTATYYEMARAVKEMAERIPLATTEIAKIVEAGARMGIQGKENLLIYAETTAVMAHAFDLPVEQVGESIGKLSQLYKIPIKDIKSLGDTINWLDDNALAKGGEIIDVMQRIAGTAAMVNMNFKEAAALGSTFLSLGATPEIAASASNAMIRELSVATMQSKRFREGLALLKLDAKALQLGMSKDATGTIIQVLDAIKALPKQQQLEAATRLFGKEFGDDAAKLAENLDEYRRQLKLVNEERARGSMQREADAHKDTVNARLTMAKNAFFNLSSDLGESLKPALTDTLERTLAIVQAVRDWAKEHPGLAGAIMKTAAVVGVLLTAVGGFIVAITAVLGPLALAKLTFVTLGVHGFGLTSILGKLGTALRWVSGLFPLLMNGLWKTFLGLGGALSAVGKGILWLGRLVLMNPIGLAITGIALAAYLIYKYWEPIKKFFSDLWDSVSLTFTLAWDGLKAWFSGLPGKLKEIGVALMEGLANGIKSGWQWVKDALGGLAKLMPGYVEKPLEVHSPSRVFERIGGYTMEGLEQGLLAGQGGPLGAVRDMARRLAAVGAGMAIASAGVAGELPRIDTRPALATAPLAAAAAPMTVTINIYGAPGQDPAAIAREVERALARIEAARAARGRSRLADRE